MIRIGMLLTLTLCVAACGLEVAPRSAPSGGKVDQSTPEALAEAIFAAAKSGDLGSLSDIASDQADKEARDIANVGAMDAAFQRTFREYFSSARVAAKPYLDGKGGAFVPIVYGKAADLEKLMVMARGEGGWYFDALVDAIDQSAPEKLAKSIFRAASTGIYSGMANIAAQDADGEVKELAKVASGTAEFQTMFREHFGTGKVSGEPLTRGDRAMVPILFGETGEKKKTLEMVRGKNGKWYLRGF